MEKVTPSPCEHVERALTHIRLSDVSEEKCKQTCLEVVEYIAAQLQTCQPLLEIDPPFPPWECFQKTRCVETALGGCFPSMTV